MQRITCFMVATVMGAAPWASGQGGDPKDLLQAKLKAQFALTATTKDMSDIVTPGAVLLLQTNGLMMYSIASPLPPVNTYKNGKISQGGGGFGRDILITMATAGNGTAADYPHRNFGIGEGLWVTGLSVQKDGIVFRLYSDVYDGVRYYGQLRFPFQKGYVPAPEQALATIAEVLTVQQTQTNEQVAATGPEHVASTGPEQVAGQYVMAQSTDNRLQLNPDGTLSLVQAGRNYSGTFTVESNKIMARIGKLVPQALILQGDALIDLRGSRWVKQTTATVAPLRLPSTYASVQTPADQLLLNADKSFSLQEAGQNYRGTFTVNGSALELTISDTNTKNTVTIQGNSLTDSSGQTWVLREQAAATAPSAAMLQNEDVIKMAKAGFDDAIIIAKISSSKCQFDTSTDTLIRLKQSGVSAAVLKAMVGAGK